MNNNSELIVLFDSISDFDDLDEIISNSESKIISFDYDTHRLLKNKKIIHETSDKYLSKSDLRVIQKTAYSVSEWYNDNTISKDLLYSEVNLGSLVKEELITILISYIKKFFGLYKISKQFTDSTFIGSQACCKIMENFSEKLVEFKNSKIDNSQLIPLDSMKIKMKIGTKSHSMEFGISKDLFKKLKNVSEKSSKLLLPKNNLRGETSKNILIIEFDPIKYQSFFEQMPYSKLNFLLYNVRRPAFWNLQGYNLIKKSGCQVETESSIFNSNLKKIISDARTQMNGKISDLFLQENFFKSFFSIEGISFWSAFKGFFEEYFRKRALELIEQVELTKKLLNKYDFLSILILSEAGPHERIILQLASQKQIPVCLVQHGIGHNTKESYDMNIAKGILPIKSDYYLCWGKISEDYCKNMDIKSEKVHLIGSAVFDDARYDEQDCSKKDHVLLATGSPTKEHTPDLTVEIIEKNMDAVKKICEIVTKYNKKLIIKMHPSPDEFDPSFIANEVNSEIEVIKEGNISPLIQSCDLLIINDLTSPILDAYIMKKPVMSLLVTDNDNGIPTAFKNNSCIRTDIEKFEHDFKNVLNDTKIRNELIINGTKSAKEYLSYHNNGSKQLIRFLEELVN